jgi:hypothetical protein
MRKKQQKKKALPGACATVIRFLCDTPKQAKFMLQLKPSQFRDIMDGKKVMVTQEQFSIIESVCKNQLKYALPIRILHILQDDKLRQLFVSWVNTAAHMLDSFMSIKDTQDQCVFINQFDPWLSGLYDMAESMSWVESLLLHIHQTMPEFDELFFHGTRFYDSLKGIKVEAEKGPVISSYDVASLSPVDEATFNKLKQEI